MMALTMTMTMRMMTSVLGLSENNESLTRPDSLEKDESLPMDDVDVTVDETNMIPGLDAPVPSSGPSNTVVCSLRSLSMNTLVAFPDTYKLEIRFLRGKKIKICIQQSHDDTIPSRMEIRFDYHFIMELDIQPDDTGEVALMLDLCRIPKFFWLESSAGGRPQFVEN